MIKDVLPKLFSCSYNQQATIWTKGYRWDESFFPGVLIYHFETELENYNGAIDLILERSKAFVEDILALKGLHPDLIELFDFLQFQASTYAIDFFSRNKLFPYCFNWINNSIGDEVSTETERQFFPGRIGIFIESRNEYISNQLRDCFSLWTNHLFYYSRSTGGLKELTEFFLEHYFEFFIWQVQRHPSVVWVGALCQISSWCNNYKKAHEERTCNMVLYEIYKVSKEITIKRNIAFQFSVANSNHTDISRKEWGEIILQDYRNDLKAHDEFQILVSLYDRDVVTLLEKLTEIKDSIKRFKQHESDSYALYGYHQGRIFSLLERLITKLVMNGYTENACEIIGLYFGIPECEIIKQPTLFIIPNSENGPVYSFPNKVIYVEGDPKTALPEIVNLENKFLGTTHTFHDILDFQLHTPARAGVPTVSFGNQYYNALNQYMNVNKVMEYEKLGQTKGYFLIYGFQMGLQPILTLNTGITLPIIHSFREPRTASEIKKAFIWQGFTQLAEKERIGLIEILTTAAVQADYLDCFASTKDEFLVRYSDLSYDLFWIVGHGEFEQHEAHKSYLNLGNDIFVGIEDLKNREICREQRRLLVLDACDGATASLANSPVSIGIGVTTISASQSLVSHTWPVENLPSMTLGLLLAVFLSQGNSYADSHSKTIECFYRGKQDVLAVIRNYCQDSEVVDRIINSEFDYQNYYYWGSLNLLI